MPCLVCILTLLRSDLQHNTRKGRCSLFTEEHNTMCTDPGRARGGQPLGSHTLSRAEVSGMSVSHSSFKCSFPLQTSSRVNHCREKHKFSRRPESTLRLQSPPESQAVPCGLSSQMLTDQIPPQPALRSTRWTTHSTAHCPRPFSKLSSINSLSSNKAP